MSTDVWVAIFTGIQTAAVVSGLIFVSVQLRDSRRIAKGGAYQNWLDTIVQFFMTLAHNEGLSELYWTAERTSRPWTRRTCHDSFTFASRTLPSLRIYTFNLTRA